MKLCLQRFLFYILIHLNCTHKVFLNVIRITNYFRISSMQNQNYHKNFTMDLNILVKAIKCLKICYGNFHCQRPSMKVDWNYPGLKAVNCHPNNVNEYLQLQKINHIFTLWFGSTSSHYSQFNIIWYALNDLFMTSDSLIQTLLTT